MSATLEEVAEALKALGITTQIAKPIGHREYLNVYTGDNRRPTDTVWPPTTGSGWIWGPSFQWEAPADDDAETVAATISRTIPK